ncbi:hypothetical protein TRVA0_095S00188 [Trichomonascus vanleenenianus]|uniref:uncharacterized protein n=1 Tax=Trichomonascus vanleenenianus TaxID=2268995 RepID=UPI003ECA1D56
MYMNYDSSAKMQRLNRKAEFTIAELKKWYYLTSARALTVVKFTIFELKRLYYLTYTQAFIAGLVNFLSIGMYNVLTSLGGAGQLDPKVASISNTILYSLFAATSLCSGPVVNHFGPRWSLFVGALGFVLYGGSFWSYNHNGNRGFVYFAGAVSGVGAGLLWTACGTVMMSYPTEPQKGRFVSMFFFLSFLGAVIGGIIPVAENYNNVNAGHVNDGTYAGITVVMIVSCGVALLLASPENVTRSDGTLVVSPDDKHERLSLIDEFKGLYWAIKKEPWILLFLPFSFSSLFYAAYQTNDYNAYFFDVRTRSINALLYGISQLIGSVLIGILMDLSFMKRHIRARFGWVVLFTTIFTVSLLGFFALKKSKRGVPFRPPMDINDPNVGKYVALYFFYGFQDGMSQGYSFWIMGTLSNDPRVLSMYSGLFKVFGAMAAAIGFGVDFREVPYINMYASYWSVSLFGCLCLVPLVFIRVNDGNIKTTSSRDIFHRMCGFSRKKW